jgi:hypothetical protein
MEELKDIPQHKGGVPGDRLQKGFVRHGGMLIDFRFGLLDVPHGFLDVAHLFHGDPFWYRNYASSVRLNLRFSMR